jgi:hypothetical protein
MGKFSDEIIKHRLELALRLTEPPTLEQVLEEISRRGVLKGSAHWTFKAWKLYVDYVIEEIIGRFKPSAEEEEQLRDFGRKLDTLLERAERQAKAKLTIIYKAVVDGTYRIEGNKLYAPDGTWMYIAKVAVPRIAIHGISASVRFPDVLKLPREKLELLQLGWRASDEGNDSGRPYMGTTQPWQVFAWTATRYGALYIRVDSVNLTREGVSMEVVIKAKSWKQRWSKDEAVDLVASHFRRGEWTPLLTMWLGDGKAKRRDVLSSDYQLIIVAREPWRLGNSIDTRKALVARGREAFMRLRESAGAYGVLLDLSKSHKWIDVKLATDDALRAAYKLKARKRSIDVLREAYNGEIPKFSPVEVDKPEKGDVVVASVMMHLGLLNGRNGSFYARRYVRDLGEALAITKKLESAGFRPNVYREHSYYMIYISMTDLLRLAERDEAVKRAIALYLADKAKNGTPWQREIAEKILKRHPLLFNIGQHMI